MVVVGLYSHLFLTEKRASWAFQKLTFASLSCIVSYCRGVVHNLHGLAKHFARRFKLEVLGSK